MIRDKVKIREPRSEDYWFEVITGVKDHRPEPKPGCFKPVFLRKKLKVKCECEL